MSLDPATHHPPPPRVLCLASTEIPAPVGGAGDEQPIMERDGGDVVLAEIEAPLQLLTADAQGIQLAAPLVPPAEGELVVGSAPTARTPVHCRVEKAASAPRPMEIGSASSSAPEAEATGVAPTEWVHGGGTSALIKAAQDVQADFRAEAAALSQCMKAFVKMRAAVQVRNLLSVFDFCSLPWGRASAPTGCSPRVLGRLLRRRPGTALWVLSF